MLMSLLTRTANAYHAAIPAIQRSRNIATVGTTNAAVARKSSSSSFGSSRRRSFSTCYVTPQAASAVTKAASTSSNQLKDLKSREVHLRSLLSEIRSEKRTIIANHPLKIGVIGYGRFGQFIASTFSKYTPNVVASSRSDYTALAKSLGCVEYIPLNEPERLINADLDVIVLAVSILSFERTLALIAPHLKGKNVLLVDVLSVKEHPKSVMLKLLPPTCDILCTHPMFGPESGKDSWKGLNFVYERTRISGVLAGDAQQAQNVSALEGDG
jgi:hypothetical protein